MKFYNNEIVRHISQPEIRCFVVKENKKLNLDEYESVGICQYGCDGWDWVPEYYLELWDEESWFNRICEEVRTQLRR